jgi:hypothetical protein
MTGPAAGGVVAPGRRNARAAFRPRVIPGTGLPSTARRARPTAAELTVLACFVAAGVVVTWPRASYLTGLLPRSIDQSQYVWNFWWVAHQLSRLGNPWFTRSIAAPVGTRLGFDTLMPLPAALLAPVTLAFGPSLSYNLLAAVTPGLACYAMYRAARLWLPGMAGPAAAGAFFGLSSMLTFQDWWHLNIAAGAVFLPLALEAAVRCRRQPSARRGLVLGLVLGCSALVNQETAVLAVIVAVLAMLPGLTGLRARLGALACAAISAVLIASPQLLAMAQQFRAGDTTIRPSTLGEWYGRWGASLASEFAPSPRLSGYRLTALSSLYSYRWPNEAITTFGLVLSVLAVAGLAAQRRRRSTWLLGLLWLGGAALALGPTLRIGDASYVPFARVLDGYPESLIMPFTWFVRIPGLSTFREADRLALLGLAGAALLAGAAIDWLRRRAWPLIVPVAILAALEAGFGGTGLVPPMPAQLPALDAPIAADRTGSIVVDVPFGITGGSGVYGHAIPLEALVLASADGHPRAVSYTSWVSHRTLAGMYRHAFYRDLIAAEKGYWSWRASILAARQDLRRLGVGWLLVWDRAGHRPLLAYLGRTGFRFDYRADGVRVFRPAPDARAD